MKRAAAVLAAAALLLTGCSGVRLKYRDLAKLQIVRTLAVDREGGGVTVTAEAGEDGGAKIYTVSAASFGEAVHLMRTAPECGDTFFAHTEHLLIGEAAAREGIEGIIDFVVRSTEMRMDADVFIVRGDGEKVLKSAGEGGVSDFLSFMKDYAAREGSSYMTDCADAAAEIEEGGAFLLSALELRRSGDITGSEALAFDGGLAVISGGKLQYFLTEEEARGAVLIENKFRGGVVTVPGPGGEAALRLTAAKVRLNPVYESEKLVSLELLGEMEAGVIQAEGADPKDAGTREALERAAAEREAEAILLAVKRAQTTGLDFLGLGAELYRQSPMRFAGTADNWEELFPELPITVTAACRVARTYELGEELK